MPCVPIRRFPEVLKHASQRHLEVFLTEGDGGPERNGRVERRFQAKHYTTKNRRATEASRF